MQNSIKSFTLVELLIVIAILSILAVGLVVAINPGEMLAEARDTNRLRDLGTLNRSISTHQVKTLNPSLGFPNIVYISLPDTSSTCATHTALPALPPTWSYRCATLENLRNINGTGWMPIDFTASPSGTPFPFLPIDPINNINHFYSYVGGTSWEIGSAFESRAKRFGGGRDRVSTDGGDDFIRYEVGGRLDLNPRSFEFSFPITETSNSALRNIWFRNAGVGTLSFPDGTIRTTGGEVQFIFNENIPFNPNALYELTCRIRQISDPVSGGRGMFCGWAGVGADGVTMVSSDGHNAFGGQHYHAVSGSTLVTGAGWTTFTGYTRGHGSPSGNWGACTNINSPCRMHQNVRYIRPRFALQHSAGNGIVEIDFLIARIMP